MTDSKRHSMDDLARRFHEAYERLAPEHGYLTREETAVPWDDVPASNRALMVATVTEAFGGLVEQFDAMRDKLDSLYAGYSAKCERFSLGTCDRSADDGQLCRICQFFLGIGWESFEVTSGGLRSWRPVSNPASRDEA